MFLLFIGQLFFPQPEVRWAFGAVYMALALSWLFVERRYIPALYKTAQEELKRGSQDNKGPPKLGP
jgi:hypothetical protein